jgi:hypothetical protein
MEARPKQGEDIQSTDDDTLVVTIAITMHGCVTTMEDVDPTNYNIRYTSATKDKLEPHSSSPLKDLLTMHELHNSFRKDTPGGDNDKVQKRWPYFDSLPYDKAFSAKHAEATNLFDRTCGNFKDFFSTFVRLPTYFGIWVISVHNRLTPQPINDYKYVYPEDKLRFINLLNLRGIEDLNEKFNNIHDLKSTLIREGLDVENKHIYMNDDNTRIESIRLSYLLELLKQIIGPKCGFNIYDFSCSTACDDSSITDTKTTTSLIKDLEAGKAPFFGGGKRKNRKTKRRRSRKKKNKKSRKRRR